MLASLVLVMAIGASDPSSIPPPAKPKLICREDQRVLGTHMHTGRRCKTAEQWQQDDARRDQIPPTLRVTEGQGDGLPRRPRPQ
jgi:hypothetical protein